MNHSFEKAFKISMKHEGGYANDPKDRGGETYCGITRKHHPDWPGWKFIDQERARSGHIVNNTIWINLEEMVKEFYIDRYWKHKKIRCDLLSGINPDIAIYCFDMAVNHGPKQAAKILQHTINRLSAAWVITEDGIAGKITRKALEETLVIDKDSVLLTIRYLRASFYNDICERDPEQDKFWKYWVKRI